MTAEQKRERQRMYQKEWRERNRDRLIALLKEQGYTIIKEA